MIREADQRDAEIVAKFERKSGLSDVRYEVKQRSFDRVIQIHVASPTERFFRIANELQSEYSPSDESAIGGVIISLVSGSQNDILQSPEARLLLRNIASTLNANRYSFTSQSDLYIRSVFGAEEQIFSAGNHIVFGRRGAGKSSLLAFAMNERLNESRPSVWLDMQTYGQRTDFGTVADVLIDIFDKTQALVPDDGIARAFAQIHDVYSSGEESDLILRRQLPALRRYFAKVTDRLGDLAIYFDDFHVVDRAIQPIMLDFIYAFARGNRVHLKLSAIETFTRTFDASRRVGMEIPQDLQSIRLDLNLTVPDLAAQHIANILDALCTNSGLPSVARLMTSADVLSRLVWISAGGPRDALSVFSEALSRSALNNARRVSVSSINEASSRAVNGKLLDLEGDVRRDTEGLKALLDSVKAFCITNNRKNAFLIEIGTGSAIVEQIRQLVDLRVLHVINESLNTGKAARRFQALILDYGFYVGLRAARSVELFNPNTERSSYDEMRALPVFPT